MYDLVVKSGFQTYDDVYRDIPEDQRPPKPGEAAAPAAEKVKVGLSFSDFATERWKNEEVLMRGSCWKIRATKSSLPKPTMM